MFSKTPFSIITKCSDCMFKELIESSSLIKCNKSNLSVSFNPLKMDNSAFPFSFSKHDIYNCSGYIKEGELDLSGLSKEELHQIILENHNILVKVLNERTLSAMELYLRLKNSGLFERIEVLFASTNLDLISKEDLEEIALFYIKL